MKNLNFLKSKALLMPNRWDEPFGLTMVESLAAGTPVIGSKKVQFLKL